VNVTNKCNLRCIYCMASSASEQQAPIVINRDFAFTGIKDAIEGKPTGGSCDVFSHLENRRRT
jgi:MoaA/NifB/PqqE/SkfB family radical SAM enzyme